MPEFAKFWGIIALVFLIVACLFAIERTNQAHEEDCLERGGRTETTGYGKYRDRLCLSPDGRVLDSW